MAEDRETSRLKNFPVSFLSVGLGLIGFTLAWQRAEHVLKLPFVVSDYLLYFTFAVSGFIAITYANKMLKHGDEVRREYNHPIKLNFFPIIAKIFLISSIIYLERNMLASKWFWWAGVVAQAAFTIIIMTAWIRHDKFQLHHINPSWFIPVVGSIIIPIAGVRHFSPELSWFFFSVGFFWWLILTTLVIYRMVFHNPIPDKLIPTLFILFAPPVIGFISLTKLTGGLSVFGNMLYHFGLFLFILILFQARLFFRIRFYLSWWAYSFPLDALAIGTLLMYQESGLPFFRSLTIAIFALLNLVMLFLAARTVMAMKRREICVEEQE